MDSLPGRWQSAHLQVHRRYGRSARLLAAIAIASSSGADASGVHLAIGARVISRCSTAAVSAGPRMRCSARVSKVVRYESAITGGHMTLSILL